MLDDRVRALQFGGPIANVLGVPPDYPPRGRPGPSAEHHHFVAVGDERTGEKHADLAGSAGDYDLHRPQAPGR